MCSLLVGLPIEGPPRLANGVPCALDATSVRHASLPPRKERTPREWITMMTKQIYLTRVAETNVCDEHLLAV